METTEQVKPSRIQIATTADAKYFIPLIALLKSMEINLRSCLPATVWVVDAGLKLRQKRLINRAFDPDRVQVRWLPPPDTDLLTGVPVFGHVNLSTYFRILLPQLLPELEKVIYLDADMLVVGDIGELWSMPMGGYPLSAVQDNNSSTIRSARIPGYRKLGLPSNAKVLNGGMLVMDLDIWRREKLSDCILAYLREYAADILFWDQDGINAILAGRWQALPYTWNWRVDCGRPEFSSGLHPERPELLASILHFSSAIKPWHYYCAHPLSKVFFTYLNHTPLRGWRPRAPWRAVMNRHYWGAKLRGVPVVGDLWKLLRK